MSDDQRSFERFMKERDAAAEAYVQGDAAPLGRIVTRRAPATFFGPRGGYREGADVWETYERDAGSFEAGGESTLDILQMGASEGIGYWVGFQRATAHLRGNPEPMPMVLRVTEVFRREGDEWKLVHRHADMLASEERSGGG
jgi:ketosteroid isomerase-like protein